LRRNQLIRFISKESEDGSQEKAEMRKRTDRAKQVLLRKMSTVKQEQTDEY
jgi:hypothetical protein